MKKCIFTLLCLTFALTSFSQVSWNVKAGMNISSWSEDADDGPDPKVGFRIGGGMEYTFCKMWAIQPSLLLSTKGVTGSVRGMGDITFNQVYLEMPVLGAARFRVGNNKHIVVSAGPYIAYGIGGKTKASFYDGTDKYSIEFNTFGKLDKVTAKANGQSIDLDPNELGLEAGELMNRFDAGIATGVAFELNKLVLGMEVQSGLIDLYDNSDVTNISVSLNVGYKF